jgi:2-desacetyl-2-hydroxyethyl bacteriochlorophyllide A dehydrogenase
VNSLVFESPMCAVLREKEIPEPGFGQVLVKIAYNSICGDDLSLYKGIFRGLHYPVVPGHEWTGTVADVGPGTSVGWLGKRVTGDLTCGCGICAACLRDETELCENRLQLGFTLPGACAEYMVVPAINLYELPRELSLRIASQAEPFAVALHALDKIEIQAGEKVAVLGADGIGLVLMNAAIWLGCEVTLVSEPIASRRQVADRYGALAVSAAGSGELVGLLKARPELRPDVVLEASSYPNAVQEALEIVRPGGRVCLVGYRADESSPMSPALITSKGLTVQGSLGPNGKLGAAISLLGSGAVDVGPLLTHEFPLSDAKTALQVTLDKSDGNIRSLLFME